MLVCGVYRPHLTPSNMPEIQFTKFTNFSQLLSQQKASSSMFLLVSNDCILNQLGKQHGYWKYRMRQIVQMSNKNSIHNFRYVFCEITQKQYKLLVYAMWILVGCNEFPVMKDLRASRAEHLFEGFLTHPCRHATQGHKGTLLGISRSKAKPWSGWPPFTLTIPQAHNENLEVNLGSKMAIETKWFIGSELIGGLNLMIIYLDLPNEPFLIYRVQSTGPHTAKSFFSQHKSNFIGI